MTQIFLRDQELKLIGALVVPVKAPVQLADLLQDVIDAWRETRGEYLPDEEEGAVAELVRRGFAIRVGERETAEEEIPEGAVF